MCPRVVVLASALILLCVAPALGHSPGHGPRGGSGVQRVVLFDGALGDVTVRAGDAIVWKNRDDQPHQVASATPDPETGHMESDGRFDTGVIRPGEKSAPIRFPAAGTFDIHSPIDAVLESATVIVLPEDPPRNCTPPGRRPAPRRANAAPGGGGRFAGPASGHGPGRVGRCRIDGMRRRGEVSESDVEILSREPSGRNVVQRRRSTLLFTGALEGQATFESTEVVRPNGRLTFQGTAEIASSTPRRPSLVLGIVGRGNDALRRGSFTVIDDGGASVAGSGVVVFGDGGGGGGWTGDFGVPPTPVDVDVEVEPFVEEDEVLFLKLAPRTANHAPRSLLILRPKITNHGLNSLRLNEIRVNYLGPPFALPTSLEKDVFIGSGTTKAVITSREENIVLPYPPPPAIVVDFYFDAAAFPVSVFRSLQAHENPTPSGSYRFPARASDLAAGEFWSGATGHKGDGQRFGYDMGVIRWNGSQWTNKHPNQDGSENADYLIWNVPIYAMADGEVVACNSGIPDNPEPPEKIHGGGGNSFKIRHGDEIVLYAHFRQGTVNQALCFEGALVEEGDLLGRAGNSGSSTAPHLHVHASHEETGQLRPLAYHAGQVVEREFLAATEPVDGPWSPLDGRGPAHRVGNAIYPESQLFTCAGELATIVGTTGHDVLIGGSGDDVIVGRGGDDLIEGHGGDDLVCGDSGSDEIFGDVGNDELHGGAGGDLIDGGSGEDTILGGSGADDLFGGDGDDQVDGGLGADTIFGDSGFFTLAHVGDDTLVGGPGNDTLEGERGDDELFGGSGNDHLAGFTGRDDLYGEGGSDVLLGEQDADGLNGGADGDFCDGGGGSDHFIVPPSDGDCESSQSVP